MEAGNLLRILDAHVQIAAALDDGDLVRNAGLEQPFGKCIGIIKGLLGGSVNPYRSLLALFAAACTYLCGSSFRLGRLDGRTGSF